VGQNRDGEGIQKKTGFCLPLNNRILDGKKKPVNCGGEKKENVSTPQERKEHATFPGERGERGGGTEIAEPHTKKKTYLTRKAQKKRVKKKQKGKGVSARFQISP